MSEKRVSLIQCTNSKRDEKALAKDLYDESSYFRAMRPWAEEMPGEWAILSAKHGLVRPNQEIEPYDERGLSVEQAKEIVETIETLGFTHVDVTAGMDYTNPLVPELEKRGIDVVNHFAGERIADREKLLKQATAEMVHHTL